MAAKSSKDSKHVANGKKDSSFHSDSDNESSNLECAYCDRKFLDNLSYEQHLESKKHYTKVINQKAESKKREINIQLEQSESEEDEYLELYCEICDKKLSGFKPYMSHMKGSIHLKNLKKQDLKEKMKGVPGIESDNESDNDLLPKIVARCTLCDKKFSDLESFRKHLISSTHTKKLQEQKIKVIIKAKQNSSSSEMEEDFYKKCAICDKEFSGIMPYHVHMNSAVHQKALKKIEMENQIKDLFIKDNSNNYICKECEKPFLDPFAFNSHIVNDSHKKYEVKKKIMGFVDSNPDIVVSKTIQNISSNVDEPDDYHVGNYILTCKICHMCFTGPESAVSHIKSKKHLNMRHELKLKKSLRQKDNCKSAAIENEEESKNDLKDNAGRSSTPTNDDFEVI